MSDRDAVPAREGSATPRDFIRERVAADVAAGREDGRVHTRFPPEPNGYLHIGHAKAICLNAEVAREFAGAFNLRFDDTNPVKEDTEYVDSIREDIRWLGFDWDDREFFASDYFERLYEAAEHLIREGDAYVDDLSAEEIRAHRGTLTEPGTPSPYRDRPVEENLDLFRRMRAGEFEDGSRVLRARIDMASPNINLRTTTAPATRGVSTRCTTSRTRCRTRTRGSPTRCAPSSSRTTARCTTGSWTTSPRSSGRSRSSSRGST